jgi:hypothetical protein
VPTLEEAVPHLIHAQTSGESPHKILRFVDRSFGARLCRDKTGSGGGKSVYATGVCRGGIDDAASLGAVDRSRADPRRRRPERHRRRRARARRRPARSLSPQRVSLCGGPAARQQTRARDRRRCALRIERRGRPLGDDRPPPRPRSHNSVGSRRAEWCTVSTWISLVPTSFSSKFPRRLMSVGDQKRATKN